MFIFYKLKYLKYLKLYFMFQHPKKQLLCNNNADDDDDDDDDGDM